MFRSALQELFIQQRQRLECVVEKSNVDTAFKKLEEMGLDIVSIDRDCCTELQTILNKRYDDPIGSNRLNGLGWTSAHVNDHMKRFLQSKMQSAGQFLRQFLVPTSEDDAVSAVSDASDDDGLAFDLNALKNS
jgi:DNA-binding NarL/FixJ family response regulator